MIHMFLPSIGEMRKIGKVPGAQCPQRPQARTPPKPSKKTANVQKLVDAAIKRINDRGNNEYDPDSARAQLTAAFTDIVKLAKDIVVIGAGWWNVVCIGGVPSGVRAWRIWYRKLWPDNGFQSMLVEELNRRDFGILAPISVTYTTECLYWEIRPARACQGYTYEQLRGLFAKALELSRLGLVWWDFNPDNIMTYHDDPVITDFDVMTEGEAMYHLGKCTRAKTKSAIYDQLKKCVETPISQRQLFAWPQLLCRYHDVKDSRDYMRVYFNYYLFQVKYNIPWGWIPESMFKQLTESPYDLL